MRKKKITYTSFRDILNIDVVIPKWLTFFILKWWLWWLIKVKEFEGATH